MAHIHTQIRGMQTARLCMYYDDNDRGSFPERHRDRQDQDLVGYAG
jgi:hypothetical protein